MSGIEIPGFEVIEKIGTGGMATVWKARQKSLDRIVAIKILYSRFSVDATDVHQWDLQQLDHRAVLSAAKYPAVGQLEGHPAASFEEAAQRVGARDAVGVGVVVGADQRLLPPVDDGEESVDPLVGGYVFQNSSNAKYLGRFWSRATRN